ncbi:hypothetical protein PsorP6_007202 [Peronosclerospora sorghi]|uniref:Uncharacterized protein n=1 Tax=Peronosclerospora sorghi TaxID=230839 RepID=A0ACC0WBL2_9STRA|nr:hypothetical protein PsorP6_007202 [Peronosclerospora sorghi]
MRAILYNEEKALEQMLLNGHIAIEKAFSKAQLAHSRLTGADAFRLYGTYGIPLGITQVLADEKGIYVDVEGFEAYVKNPKQQNSDRCDFVGQHTQPSPLNDTKQFRAIQVTTVECKFVGSEHLDVSEARVLSSWENPSSNAGASTKCSFSFWLCRAPHSNTFATECDKKAELGEHIAQAGSLVTNDCPRFDCAHFGALSFEYLANVEAKGKELAAAELKVSTVELPREEAERSGAICNFGGKYGDIVRIVRIGEGSDDAGSDVFIPTSFAEEHM